MFLVRVLSFRSMACFLVLSFFLTIKKVLSGLFLPQLLAHHDMLFFIKSIGFIKSFLFLKKVKKKKIEETFLSTQRNYVQQNRLVDIAPEHCFGVTLTEF